MQKKNTESSEALGVVGDSTSSVPCSNPLYKQSYGLAYTLYEPGSPHAGVWRCIACGSPGDPTVGPESSVDAYVSCDCERCACPRCDPLPPEDCTTSAWSVLLVPAAGDPHRLLFGGRCGSQPPMAMEWTDGVKLWWRAAPCHQSVSRVTDWPTGRRALPLAWEGSLVWEGEHRAARALFSVPKNWTPDYRTPVDMETCIAVAELLASRGVGSVLILYKEGSRVILKTESK